MTLQQYMKILNENPFFIEIKLTPEGETLMQKDILKKIFESKKGDAHVSFYTNGTLLTPETNEKLVDSHLDEITISLNGATKKTHEYINNGSNWDETINNIKNLVQTKKNKKTPYPEIAISLVAMNQNIDEIPKLINLAKKLEIQKITIHPMQNNSSELAKPENNPAETPTETDEKMNNNQKLATQNKIQITTPTYTPQKQTLTQMCQEPWTKMNISPTGEVTPCCQIGISFGNIFTQKTKTIWNGKKYQQLRTQVKNKNQPCHQCKKQFEQNQK